jgi:Lon protease-like protein
MSPHRIPLFPLEVVLFPGTLLPLHIFEPRYKQMVRQCLEAHTEFGVVLARREGIAPVGCTAHILHVVRTYPDGRMDIVAAGEAAFEIVEVHDQDPSGLLEGDVEYLEEEAGGASEEAGKELLRLFGRCHAHVYGRPPDPPEWGDPPPSAFRIAQELPLDLDLKQELLELRSEGERQARLVEQMRRWLPKLRAMDKARRAAGGNGQGRG